MEIPGVVKESHGRIKQLGDCVISWLIPPKSPLSKGTLRLSAPLLNKLSLSQKLQKPLLAGCSLGWLLTPPNLPLPRGGVVGGGVFSNRRDWRNAVFSEICLTDSLTTGVGGISPSIWMRPRSHHRSLNWLQSSIGKNGLNRTVNEQDC